MTLKFSERTEMTVAGKTEKVTANGYALQAVHLIVLTAATCTSVQK